jgi:hypothetical protein
METNLTQEVLSKNIGTVPRPDLIERELLSKNIGTVTRTELIEREIIFDSPQKDVVLKVINIQSEVEIKNVEVTSGNILVTGYLNECIMYTTMKRPQMESSNQDKNNQNGNNQNANSSEKHGYTNMVNDKSSGSSKNSNKNKSKEKVKPSCGVVDNSIALDGVLRHTTVWIPFKAFIPAAEVKENDICTVTSSAVLTKNNMGAPSVTPIYEEEYDEEEVMFIMRDEKEQKFIKGIINKTLIEFTVDISRLEKL